MTRLEWDQPGERLYETGLDRGVLYLPNGRGIPWNGLVSVHEKFEDVGSEPLHIDGLKYFDDQTVGDFAATIQAFTYPDEFLEFEGTSEVNDVGLFATYQNRPTFGLSYRTLIGNDTQGTEYSYKIHVLYNLTAVPTTKDYTTLTNSPTLSTFAWDISSVPEPAPGFRPTGHIIFDMTDLSPLVRGAVEGLLWGDQFGESTLPSIVEFQQLIGESTKLTITDNGDGSWTADGPLELVRMIGATEFQIDEVDAIYTDADTYQVTTTQL